MDWLEILQWALLIWVILREFFLRQSLSIIINNIYKRILYLQGETNRLRR